MILLIAFGLAQAATSGPVLVRTYENAINGNKIGESSVSVLDGNTTRYNASIHVGSIGVDESLTVTKTGGMVTQYQFLATQAGVQQSFNWDGKVLKVDSGKTKQDLPFKESQMPQLWSGNYLGGVHDSFRNLTWKPGEQKQSVQIFLVDAQGILPATVTKEPNHSYQLNGQTLAATQLQMEIAGVKANLFFAPGGDFLGEEVASQHYTILEKGVTGLFTDEMAKYPELSQAQYKVRTVDNLECTLRDGTKLMATALVPEGDQKWPVILERTPYGRALSIPDGGFYAPRGYAVIVQDVRGTGDSGGKFDPFMNEIKDGYDTAEWAAHLPFSNGKVGMIGASYLGGVQWQAAVADPPALKCIVPQVSPPDAFHNFPYEYGTFMLYPSLWWGNIVKQKNADMNLVNSKLKDPVGLTALPLSQVPHKALGSKIPFFDDWLKRDGLNKWKGFDFESYLLKAKVPALQVSGWWDGDGIGTDLHWLKMREAKRKNQWLIEGPWVHEFNRTTSVDDQNYGPQSILELDSVYLRFFDHFLKGKDDGWSNQPKARYFVMGENKWHNTSDFPDPKAHQSRFYLNSGHRLASKVGRGVDRYKYNPAKDTSVAVAYQNPMSTAGALHVKLPQSGKGLYFVSTPFTRKTIIEGPYGVDLWVKIDRPTTNLFVDLVKINASGTVEVISMPGKFNLSYLKGLDKPRKLVPGEVYKVHLFPWISAMEFKKGEKFGLIVSSTEFPIMARNLNTGEPIATGKRMVPVNVTVLHDRSHPSQVTFYKIGG